MSDALTQDQRAEIQISRSGKPTLIATDSTGKRFHYHSSYDPQRSAEEWAERQKSQFEGATVVVMLGVGLGYEAEAVLSRLGEKQKLVLIEAADDVWAAARGGQGPLDAVLADARVHAFHGEMGDDFRQVLARLVGTPRGHLLALLSHPAATRMTTNESDQYLHAIRQAVNKKVRSLATVVLWSQVWPRNTLDNLPHWAMAPGIRNLYGRLEGVPAILVSAGPSLNKNVKLLREAKGKFFVACVGTALKVLLAEGIKPDLVVTLDGGHTNARHFRGLDIDDIPLAVEPFTHPDILRNYKGLVWSFEVNNPIALWFEPVRGKFGHIRAGGSVAHSTLDILVKAGCDPIVFVGQDLALGEDGRTHAIGTTFPDGRMSRGGRGAARKIPVKGYYGETVYTSGDLEAMLRWFEEYIGGLGDRPVVIDATEGGASIDGTRALPLSEVIRMYGRQRSRSDFRPLLQQIAAEYRAPEPQRIAARIDEAIEELSLFGERAGRIVRALRSIKSEIHLGEARVAKYVRRFERLNEENRTRMLGRTLVGQVVLPDIVNWQASVAAGPNTDDPKERYQWVADRWLEIFEPAKEACDDLVARFESAKSQFADHLANLVCEC